MEGKRTAARFGAATPSLFRELHGGALRLGHRLSSVGLFRKLAVRGPILSLLRLRSRRRNRVLLYHRVVGDDVATATLDLLAGAIRRREFAAQMRFLARHYHVVAVDELLARRHEPGNRIAVTFDDGYADNLEHALPVLRELGLPATIFVVTGYVGTERRFWWDVAARRILHNGPQPLRLQAGAESVTIGFERGARSQLHAACEWLGRLDVADLEQFANGDGRHGDDRVMTVDELRTLHAHNVTIEAHTKSHARLAGLQRSAVERELQDSKTMLEHALDRRVRYFAYPFGERDDFDTETQDVVRQVGFEAAFAAYRGVVDKDTDLCAVPRVPSNPDLDRFKLRLARY